MGTYDYIITGAGAAGLSLAYRMVEHPQLKHCRIALIDADEKTQNDRTWCFWSAQEDLFSPLVSKTWSQLVFKNERGKYGGALRSLQYKMIRSADFYAHVKQKLNGHPNVDFFQEKVFQVHSRDQFAEVITDQQTFQCKEVFNSCLFPDTDPPPDRHFLWQHFAGWWIETEKPAFQPDEAVLMDFRTPQEGATRFFYQLPLSPTRALIEYTIFSAQQLTFEAYQSALKKYLSDTLGITNYRIVEHEAGAIPMSDRKWPANMGPRVINIGTVGGAVKPTTGYAFQNIQRQTAQIVDQLAKGQSPDSTLTKAHRFAFYDRLLLHLLSTQGGTGKNVFSALFKKVPMKLVLRFLEERTSLWQDIRILASLPVWPFLKAWAGSAYLSLKAKGQTGFFQRKRKASRAKSPLVWGARSKSPQKLTRV